MKHNIPSKNNFMILSELEYDLLSITHPEKLKFCRKEYSWEKDNRIEQQIFQFKLKNKLL